MMSTMHINNTNCFVCNI